MDSVYQLKDLCKEFYKKRQSQSIDLIQMLDSLSNDRPEMFKMKKRHFDIEQIGVEPLKETMHWMRLNAERERIVRFR